MPDAATKTRVTADDLAEKWRRLQERALASLKPPALQETVRSPWFVTVVCGIAGVVAGYFLGRRRGEPSASEEADEATPESGSSEEEPAQEASRVLDLDLGVLEPLIRTALIAGVDALADRLRQQHRGAAED
ncbi:hypothetical protein LLH03_01395 [bacterium]|nr:hypothetical protein [bacterium]